MDIHNYEKKYQRCIELIKKANISERNKQLILENNENLILEGLSKPRLCKYIEILKLLAQRLDKDFDKATKEDLRQIVSDIQQEKYSPWTKQTYKVILRRFYKRLVEEKKVEDIASWINIRMKRSEKKLPSEGDLLKEEEIKKLISVSCHPRDKALVSVLWESGARVSEIGNLRIKDISFDEHGAVLSVTGKTGSRKIRLIWCVPYLSTWMNNHYSKENSNSALWVNIGNVNHKKPMNYQTIRALLIRLAEKARIKKRINPHTFRHSRATFMANHLTEFQMNQYFGWIQGSDMPSTYVHLSGRDVDNAIFAMNGIQVENKKEESKLLPIKCPRCDVINNQDNKYCNKCGGILDITLAIELQEKQQKMALERNGADEIMSKLFQDKEVQNFLMERMKSLNISNFSF